MSITTCWTSWCGRSSTWPWRTRSGKCCRIAIRRLLLSRNGNPHHHGHAVMMDFEILFTRNMSKRQVQYEIAKFGNIAPIFQKKSSLVFFFYIILFIVNSWFSAIVEAPNVEGKDIIKSTKSQSSHLTKLTLYKSALPCISDLFWHILICDPWCAPPISRAAVRCERHQFENIRRQRSCKRSVPMGDLCRRFAQGQPAQPTASGRSGIHRSRARVRRITVVVGMGADGRQLPSANHERHLSSWRRARRWWRTWRRWPWRLRGRATESWRWGIWQWRRIA